MVLQALGKEVCWLAPCVTYGAGRSLGLAHFEALVSLVFQSESSMSCSRGKRGGLSSGCDRK
jgi:hypothetical protein